MYKPCIVLKRLPFAITNEYSLLKKFSNPFIVNMHYAFQDKEYLYLVVDLMEGNNLRYHMNMHHFTEIEASIFLERER